MAAVIPTEGEMAKTVVVTEGGQLPAATVTDNDLFVVYGLSEAESQTLWLARIAF